MFPALEFEPVEHAYSIGGRRVPSVTQVMKAERLIDDRWYDEWSMERGSAVHMACEFMDQGELDEASIDPRIRGYLDAWHRFLTETMAEVVHIELQVYSPAWDVAGRIDRVMSFGGDLAVVDLKTGTPGRAGGIQTAAYERLLLDTTGERIRARRCVQLHDDGRYTMHTYRDRSDRAVFEAALTLYKWRTQ